MPSTGDEFQLLVYSLYSIAHIYTFVFTGIIWNPCLVSVALKYLGDVVHTLAPLHGRFSVVNVYVCYIVHTSVLT
jgi:hypothetical protein